jgi:hypothetical protein
MVEKICRASPAFISQHRCRPATGTLAFQTAIARTLAIANCGQTRLVGNGYRPALRQGKITCLDSELRSGLE